MRASLSFVFLGVIAAGPRRRGQRHAGLQGGALGELGAAHGEALRGKVVLVDFWEYTCINWIRTSPYVKAWHRDYAEAGLVVVGVHAPEFEFGKRAENIDRGIRDHGLTYPIALDNEFATWRASATTPGRRSTSSTRRGSWSSGG